VELVESPPESELFGEPAESELPVEPAVSLGLVPSSGLPAVSPDCVVPPSVGLVAVSSPGGLALFSPVVAVVPVTGATGVVGI